MTFPGPIVSRRRIAVTLAGLGLLALVAGAALAPSAASAPAQAAAVAPAEVAAVQADLSLPAAVDVDNPRTGLGCWVTGDMVWSPEGGTNGNPADMTRALRGGR